MNFDEQDCVMTIVRNITKAVLSERVMEKERLTDVMLGTISHNLDTPMNAIVNTVDLLDKPS